MMTRIGGGTSYLFPPSDALGVKFSPHFPVEHGVLGEVLPWLHRRVTLATMTIRQ